LFEVGDDVFDVFDPHGEAHVVIGDPGALTLFRRELGVRGRSRMNCQGAGIADVGDVAVQLKRIDEFAATFEAGLQSEANERAKAISQVFLGEVMVFRGL